jgi:BirA family biotin operon repressor/biotin-[acetyl-CoA-carboxylase] ligase
VSVSVREFMNEAALLTRAERGTWATYSRVGSTNSVARSIAEKTSATVRISPTVVLAWHQTHGRGRNGRLWICGPGEGVLATVLVRLEDSSHLGILPLLAGVTLAEELETMIAAGVRIQWPNDLYVREAKIGGVLVEGVSRGSSSWAVIGFGINYGSEPPRFETKRTTSLSLETEAVPSLARTGVQLSVALVRSLSSLSEAVGLVERAEKLSSHQVGAEVRIRSPLREFSGRYMGLDSRGFLMLETAVGIESVSVGEIVQE